MRSGTYSYSICFWIALLYNVCSPQAKEYIVGNIVAAEWASPLSGIADNNAMQQLPDERFIQIKTWETQRITNESLRNTLKGFFLV